MKEPRDEGRRFDCGLRIEIKDERPQRARKGKTVTPLA
jgi:hypothetical protein